MKPGTFIKYQALGNDYLVLDPDLLGAEPTPEAIIAICDRNRGPGSDGVLLGGRGSDGKISLRIFNPDGSEAEKSGNGLRIFARHFFEADAAHPREFPVVTKGGVVVATILDQEGRMVRVDMGQPRFDQASVGFQTMEGQESVPDGIIDKPAEFDGHQCRMTCVSMGNPHCVLRGPPVNAALARRVGPLVEVDRLFPNRTNVQFLEVVSRAEIRIEIWERGAGYTLSSGSSSCAAAAAARRLGLVDDRVTVVMPGGRLSIEFIDDHAFMTGPVEKVYEGSFSAEYLRRIGLPC